MFKRAIRFSIGLLLAAVCLAFVLRAVNLTEVARAMGRATVAPLVLAVILNLGTFWLRTLRWGHLLGDICNVGVLQRLRAIAIGFMLNNVLPARAGEIGRAYALPGRDKLPLAVFATIVLERLFDTAAIGALFLLAVWQLDPATITTSDQNGLAAVLNAATGFAAVGLLGTGTLCLLLRNESWLKNLLSATERTLPAKLHKALEHVVNRGLEGIACLGNLRAALFAAGYSIAVWSLAVTLVIAVGNALELPFSFPQATVILAATCVAAALPASPAYVGTFHFAAFSAASWFGVDAENAVAFATILHLVMMLPVTLMGGIALMCRPHAHTSRGQGIIPHTRQTSPRQTR